MSKLTDTPAEPGLDRKGEPMSMPVDTTAVAAIDPVARIAAAARPAA
jgi:hypothetical protein